MPSVLNVDTIADKAGTGPVGLTKQIAPKTFSVSAADGTSITDSFNISTLTDTGTGLQTFSLTNSMSDANYAALCVGTNSGGSMITDSVVAGSYRTAVRNFSNALFDDIPKTAAVGDLA